MDFFRKLWGLKSGDEQDQDVSDSYPNDKGVEPKDLSPAPELTPSLSQARKSAAQTEVRSVHEAAFDQALQRNQDNTGPDEPERTGPAPSFTFKGAESLQEKGHMSQTESHTEVLRVGYASDVGLMRDHNEDTLIAFQGVHLGYQGIGPFGFFVVADGMGGHQAGEVASTLAARLVTQQVIDNIYVPYLLNESPSAARDPLTEILRNAVEKANDLVSKKVPGGGTTLTCALIMGQRAYIAHVGDSRAYLLTEGDLRQLTQDHSFVNRLIELGELSPEEAAVHPQRHVLYRAVGQGDPLDIDTYQQPLPSGSRLLLCSDGLSGQVPEKEIGTIIASEATLYQACQSLIEAANRSGGPDNITAILIETP